MARWLVTGGAGFLGSHLVDRLLARGDHVLAIDNLYTGSEDNLRAAKQSPRFSFRVADVRDPLPEHVEGAPLDGVLNLACPASPVHYQRDPHLTLTTSVLGALRLVELLEKRPGLRIVQASTSEVYGDPDVHPQPESYWGKVNPIGPRACYDEGKRVAETFLVDAHRRRPFPLQILRLFNTYGPRMALDDGRVVSSYLVSALRGEPLTVFGAGTQTRSFTYVDDTVSAFVAALGLDDFDGPINVGNPEELTVRELVEVVAGALGEPLRVEHRPLPVDDPRQRRPDISRARARLGFSPTVLVAEGMQKTLADFRGRVTSNPGSLP